MYYALKRILPEEQFSGPVLGPLPPSIDQ